MEFEGAERMVRGLIAGLGTGAVVAVLGLGALSVLAPLPANRDGAPVPAMPVPSADPAAGAVVEPLVAAPKPVAPAPAPPPAPAAPAPLTAEPGATPEAVSVPAASEFARGAGDKTPAAPAQEEAPLAGGSAPEAPAEPVKTMPLVATAPMPAARPEAPVAPAAPTLPAAPGDDPVRRPAAEAPVPVPPPGAARAPALGSGGAEIMLMPNGAPAPANLPRVFAPGQQVPGTVVNRLPTIGSEPPPLIEPAPGAAAPSGQTVMAIVLIDVGVAAGGLDRAAIKALDVPVTVAIDPARPDAAEAAADYRAAGIEVAILATDLPEGATAQDAEVALEAWRRAVPGAVAVVEPPAPAFQNDRLVAQAMVKALEREGLALVTQQGAGTNAAAGLARADGLPEAGVWRVLDAARDSDADVGRALDRAEFEATRAGGTTVMLHAWPASVMGLREWAEAGPKVTPAPVSAALTKD